MIELITIGEAMGTLTGSQPAPLADGSCLRLGFAGAEATVAIGVSRLGHRCAWVGNVGYDAIGSMILGRLRAERVDVSAARVDPELPTGLMLRERRTADRIRATYYRRGLAGAQLSPVDPGLIRGAKVLHITGITPALSSSARAAIRTAVEIAADAGVTVSLDLNYRAALWSREDAAEELAFLASQADLVFASPDEAELVSGLAPRELVIKLGADGAVAHLGTEVIKQAAVPVTAVDPIGAGDAFVAGYLAALLDGEPVSQRLRLGAVCGAFAVSVHGDWEGLPHRHELGLLDAADITR